MEQRSLDTVRDSNRPSINHTDTQMPSSTVPSSTALPVLDVDDVERLTSNLTIQQNVPTTQAQYSGRSATHLLPNLPPHPTHFYPPPPYPAHLQYPPYQTDFATIDHYDSSHAACYNNHQPYPTHQQPSLPFYPPPPYPPTMELHPLPPFHQPSIRPSTSLLHYRSLAGPEFNPYSILSQTSPISPEYFNHTSPTSRMPNPRIHTPLASSPAFSIFSESSIDDRSPGVLSDTSHNRIRMIGRKRAPNDKNKEKKHACDYPGCTKAYNKNSHLKDHKRTHTKEKPFICEYDGCPKKFGRSDELKRHVRRMHTFEKPFKCDYCEDTFARSDHCNLHMTTHDPEHVEQKNAKKVMKARMRRFTK